MGKEARNRGALTCGQLAKRWGVSTSRVRHLIDAGLFAAAFEIPAAGGFGPVLKIPLKAVQEAERNWSVPPSSHPNEMVNPENSPPVV